MEENIAFTKETNETSEAVRFYLTPRGSGRINMKQTLAEAVFIVFPTGTDLHATLNEETRTLIIKDM